MKLLKLLIILSLGILNFANSAYSFTIMLDPGHGGKDQGAVANNITESELTLDLSLRVKKILESKSFSVELTRTHDHEVSLAERISLAKKNKAELFVSIHANSEPSKSVTGFEVFTESHLAPEDDLIRNLAHKDTLFYESDQNSKTANSCESTELDSILTDLNKTGKQKISEELAQELALKWPKTRIRKAPFVVLIQNPIPAVLIEVGFLTHPQEAARLKKIEYRDAISERIAESLIFLKEKVD